MTRPQTYMVQSPSNDWRIRRSAQLQHAALFCRFETRLDIPVCRHDKFAERSFVYALPPADLHMTHAFAGAFQKVGRVIVLRPVEETDIHMRTEGVDIPKRRVGHACSGTPVVQKFAHVCSATAHTLEPWPRYPPQFVIWRREPSVDARVSLKGARQQKEFFHRFRLPDWPAMSRPCPKWASGTERHSR